MPYKHIYIYTPCKCKCKKLHLHDFTCSCKITCKNMSFVLEGVGFRMFLVIDQSKRPIVPKKILKNISVSECITTN